MIKFPDTNERNTAVRTITDFMSYCMDRNISPLAFTLALKVNYEMMLVTMRNHYTDKEIEEFKSFCDMYIDTAKLDDLGK